MLIQLKIDLIEIKNIISTKFFEIENNEYDEIIMMKSIIMKDLIIKITIKNKKIEI